MQAWNLFWKTKKTEGEKRKRTKGKRGGKQKYKRSFCHYSVAWKQNDPSSRSILGVMTITASFNICHVVNVFQFDSCHSKEQILPGRLESLRVTFSHSRDTECLRKENDKGRHEHSSVARSPTGYKTKEMTVARPPQSLCSQQFSVNVGESCFPARRWWQYKMREDEDKEWNVSGKLQKDTCQQLFQLLKASASLSSVHQGHNIKT